VGPSQTFNTSASASGWPIRIDNANGVTSFAVDIVHESALLQITAAVRGAGLPTDWTVQLDPSTPGRAKLTASGTTPLTGANLEIARFLAAVPSDALYGDSQAIRLENVLLNGGALAARGDWAIHKTAYLGDADGSGIHSSADAFLVVQAALGLASGLPAHAWTDPRIVGDADGSGLLSAADAFLIVQEGLGLSEPFVPDNPHIGVTHVGGGIDPQFQIGINLPATAGEAVTVPVQLDVEAAATNVGGLDFELYFDASQLTLDVPGGVSPGADTTGGWAVSSTLVAPGQLRVGMLNLRGQPFPTGLRDIAQLAFRVNATATAGLVALDLEPVDPHAGGYLWTAADGSLLISPAAMWHNAANPFDVNGDGAASAHDVLLVINYVNSHPGNPDLPSVAESPARYYDVNDDQACTASDVLAVINYLHNAPLPDVEGEAAGLAPFRAENEITVGSSPNSPHTPGAEIGTRSVPSTIFGTPRSMARRAVQMAEKNPAQPHGSESHATIRRQPPDVPTTATWTDAEDGRFRGRTPEWAALDDMLSDIADDIAAVWSRTQVVPSRSGFPA
jgi:hypothetical protein